MHFPPCFRFPPIFEKYSDSADNFQNFPEKEFLDFHTPKFLMTFFFSHRPQISNFPLFSLFQYTFPPVSRKLLFPPTLKNFPSPVLQKIRLLFTYFSPMCISFPPTLTMMHLCITQCTYWHKNAPLSSSLLKRRYISLQNE